METYNFFTKYYDEIVRWNGYSLDDEVDLLVEFIEKFWNNSKTIFELACGTWVVAKKLEEKWYKVSWLDISENMLKKAQKNLWKGKCFLWDMTDFNLENKVDVILCNYIYFIAQKL